MQRCAQHGIGKPWMGAEREQSGAVGGSAVIGIDGIKGAQKIVSLGISAGWRRVQET